MEIYEVQGSDGKTYKVEGPPNSNIKAIQSYVESKIRAETAKRSAETFQEKIRKQASKSDE